MKAAKLQGRRVVITGGARGIGAETARACLAAGATVVIGDLDAALAAKTAAELGILHTEESLDVADPASFARFLDRAEALSGPLDVLINNAGIMPVGPLLEESDSVARRMVDIDLHGVITGTKLAAARMVPHGGGHVINIASYVARLPMPGGATYSAAKAGVEAFTEAARRELKPTGVTLTSILPSLTTTELATGTTPSKAMPSSTPQQVAAAIIGAIVRPRPSVCVPGHLWVARWLLAALGLHLRDFLLRRSRVDALLMDIDDSARAAYEQRARTGG